MRSVGKFLLYATSASVVLYGLALLYHVHRAEDLGLDCLFTDEQPSAGVDGQPAPQISWVDRETKAIGRRPRRGDRLVRVGGQRVSTFLHVKRTVAALAQPATWSAADEVQTAATATSLAGASGGPALAQVGTDRWVRVDFIASTSSGGAITSSGSGGVSSAWLQLKPLSNRFLMLSIAWFLLEMIILAIGAVAVRKRPGDRSAAMFFALCAVHVVTFMGAFHWSNLVGSRVLVYPFVFCTILLAPMTLHFYLLFPRPRRLIQQWPRVTLAAIYAMPAAWIAFIFACLVMAHRLYQRSAEPAELTRWLNLLSASIYGYLVVAVAMFAVGWAVLIHGYARARTAAQRNQIRWVLAAVLLATSLTGYLLYLATTDRAAFAFSTSTRLTLYLTSVLFTLAYAVSITRYKLMQVGQLVNRGMLYVMISLGATALYCLMVGAGTALLGKYYFRWENALAAGLAAMLVAMLLGWIRDRFQKALDRRFIREKYQLNKAMRRLSDAVDQLVEPAALARQFLRSAADAVGVAHGVVYLRAASRGRFVPAARSGWPVADGQLAADSPLVAELRAEGVLTSRGLIGVLPSAGKFQLRDLGAEVGVALELDGDVVGLAILGPKEDADPYTPEDFNFLVALARTTALALRSASERRTIEAQKERLGAQVDKIAELQQQVHLLQGEFLGRGDAAASDSESAATTESPEQTPPLKHRIRGNSPAVRQMLAQAARVARSDASVLVRGESGTGKELLAQAIHDNSPRAAGRFVPVHCAALSPGLLESELFGHVKGAFTGADRDRVGRFESAHGGTLFLDEIGDISLETQIKLLRVLQERSFERVGGVDTIRVDVRLITTTHQNLEALIRKGRFRQDLFYRLNVISVWCPPLRERREDIFELALHFLGRYAERSGKTIHSIEDGALEALAAYYWPGNIRQLENAIQRACVLTETESIGASDLPPEVVARLHARPAAAGDSGDPHQAAEGRRRKMDPAEALLAAHAKGDFDDLHEEVTTLERDRLQMAMTRAGGNKSQAARLLGIPRSTFFYKLKRHGLD